MRHTRPLCLAVLAAACLLGGLPVEAEPVKAALLSIRNAGSDVRADYLEGIIRGVLLYDLSSTEDMQLVNRAELEAILREQELQLSSLADQQQKALEVGRILGADYLLKGEYVFLGTEVLLTLSAIEVGTARTHVFTDRGAGENLVHALAEQIVLKLAGREVELRTPLQDRSIISLRDEKPGSIALHTPLVDAEIFLDGEFAGYSTGDGRVPFVLDGVAPGPHLLRLHLGRFGVVREPQITFHDWEEKVTVQPGKRLVVRATAAHFNEIIYRLQQRVREGIPLSALKSEGSASRRHDASFTDRQGKRVEILLEVRARMEGERVEAEAVLTYDGQPHRWRLAAAGGEEQELQESVGKVRFEMEIDWSEVDYSIWRTDIEQNMFD